MQRPFIGGRCRPHSAASHASLPLLLLLASLAPAIAHGVAEGDKGYIQEISGINLMPFVYLGAKHMMTGYDHLLFLFGVVFFLYRMKHVAIYVSLFALGHSTTLIFGLFHGFGLSTKILDYNVAADGLVPNLLAFNVGVEIGQILALTAILIAMGFWRRTSSFLRHAYTANTLMMTAGFVLIGYQLTGFFVSPI